MRQGYCYTCLAMGGGISGYFGRVTKSAAELRCPNRKNEIAAVGHHRITVLFDIAKESESKSRN